MKDKSILIVYAQWFQDYVEENNPKGMHQVLNLIQDTLVKQKFTLKEASEFYKQYILKK